MLIDLVISRRLLISCAAGIAAFSCFASNGYGQLAKAVIASTGESTPSEDGTYSGFYDAPVLSEQGQVAVRASLTSSSAGTTGIFRFGSSDIEIARSGQSIAGGTISDFSDRPQINGTGQVAFMSRIAGGPASGDVRVVRGDGNSLLLMEGRVGYPRFGFNSAGEVSTYTGSAIVRGDGSNGTTVATAGASTPPSGTMYAVYGKSINDAGKVAFFATIANASGGSLEDEGIFVSDGISQIEIVREGQTSPLGTGVFASLGDPQINNGGRTAFFGLLRPPGADTSNSWGLFARDADGTLHELVRTGQTAPEGGIFVHSSQFHTIFAQNESGDVAFPAEISTTSGQRNGIFISRNGSITEIVRGGDLAPDPSRRFSTLPLSNALAFSDTGDLAFLATTQLASLSGNQNPDSRSSLFYHDSEHGLVEIAREGDELLGSFITNLSFAETSGLSGYEAGGINNQNQLAFLATLANGTQAIVVATVPEPAGIGTFTLLAFCLLNKRRSYR